MNPWNALATFFDIGDVANVESAVAHYRQRTVIALQLAFLLGALIGMMLFHETSIVLTATSLSIVSSLLSLWLAWKGWPRPAVFILAIQFLLLPFGLAFGALGVYDSGMLLSPAGMVAMAVVTRPSRVALFAAGNVILAALVLQATLAGQIGSPLPPPMLASASVDGITSLIVLTFCGIVAVYIAFILTTLLHALSRQQVGLESTVSVRTQALTHTNQELRSTLETLENARHELVRGEKLASLGRLVAGVAHELNTPLGNASVAVSTLEQTVAGFAASVAGGQLKRRELDAFIAHCGEGVDLIARSLDRSRDLVLSFKQVAADQTSERRRLFALNDVVHDVLRTLRPGLASKDWQLLEEVPAGIDCDGYPGPLGQVITNLVQNAILHGFDGRTQGTVRIGGELLGPERCQLIVSDNGAGIPAANLERIFDPFFTTRLGQGGSGLGLAICHNIVTTMLGGKIEVTSTPGAGTTFTITLPRNAPRLQPAA